MYVEFRRSDGGYEISFGVDASMVLIILHLLGFAVPLLSHIVDWFYTL